MSYPVDIPQPRGLPFFGNALDLDREVSLNSFVKFGDEYGEVYALQFPAGKRIFVCSAELMKEISDEKRFCKAVTGALDELRAGVGKGVFSARDGEKEWGIAHRILAPAFGTRAIEGCFDDMYEIASQMLLKWIRYGPEYKIGSDDFVRMALDTIALCAMDFRFNSYYREGGMHPFVGAMSDFMTEAGNRAARPWLLKPFARTATTQYAADIKVMNELADEILGKRKRQPTQKRDLLNAMIEGEDPETGEKLDDRSITDNLKTFLIAGHETPGCLQSFIFYELLKNPETYHAAQEEVDRIVGTSPLTASHLPQLKYLAAVIRETLRLHPAATLFSVIPRPDLDETPLTLGNGRYRLEKGVPIVALLSKIQRDPLVYGLDADEFKPERMQGERFASYVGKGAWKAFGNGGRSCLGRGFAWQEAMLATAMMLQNFDFEMDDPTYELKLKQTLTIKPKDFFLRAKPRRGLDPAALSRRLAGCDTGRAAAGRNIEPDLVIAYSEESGQSKWLAYRLAQNAPENGYLPDVRSLKSLNGRLCGAPVVSISEFDHTASGDDYDSTSNGPAPGVNQTPNTAFHLERAGEDEAQSPQNAWSIRFSLSPTMSERYRLTEPRDVQRVDVASEFETWTINELWPAIRQKCGARNAIVSATDQLTVEMCDGRPLETCADVLVCPRETPTHIQQVKVTLPDGVSYRSGDHLSFRMRNNKEDVQRAMERFGLEPTTVLKISSPVPTLLPTQQPIQACKLFSAYLDLTQPASKKTLRSLLSYASDAVVSPLLSASDTQTLLSVLLRHTEIPYPLSEFVRHTQAFGGPTTHPITSSPLETNSVATCALLNTILPAGTSPHVDISLIPGPAEFRLPATSLQDAAMVFIASTPAMVAGYMSELSLRTPSPKEVTVIVLQPRWDEVELQVPGNTKVFDGFDDSSKKELVRIAKDASAAWYLKGTQNEVAQAREICKQSFRQGCESGDVEEWYLRSVKEWVILG